MIQITNIETHGWEAAVRGMRNPMNSWDRSDSSRCSDNLQCEECPLCKVEESGIIVGPDPYIIGPNDLSLMYKLAKTGLDHAKYRRMITVTMDILAPLYWWKEFDTYKVGTVVNSCSTMHKITEKEFTLNDFSHDRLFNPVNHPKSEGLPLYNNQVWDAECVLEMILVSLNHYRKYFLETKDKKYWWQIIQLLPSSYNQLRTVQLNYDVLSRIYYARRNHKLDEWVEFCKMVETLPYSEIITVR